MNAWHPNEWIDMKRKSMSIGRRQRRRYSNFITTVLSSHLTHAVCKFARGPVWLCNTYLLMVLSVMNKYWAQQQCSELYVQNCMIHFITRLWSAAQTMDTEWQTYPASFACLYVIDSASCAHAYCPEALVYIVASWLLLIIALHLFSAHCLKVDLG